MQQLCRAFVPVKRIDARHIQIGQPLVLKQQKQESLTCFIRFYLTVRKRNFPPASQPVKAGRLKVVLPVKAENRMPASATIIMA